MGSKVMEIVFVCEDCTSCKKLSDCGKGQIRMRRLDHIVERTRPETVTIVDPNEEGFQDVLSKKELPDLWMHDFDIDGNELDVMPYGEYYFLIYRNGRRRCAIIVDDELEDFSDLDEERPEWEIAYI